MGKTDMNIEDLVRKGLLYKPPCKFKHFKGTVYVLIGYAVNTETNELMAIYYPEHNANTKFTRPYQMFIDMVECDGKQVQRFRPLGRTNE